MVGLADVESMLEELWFRNKKTSSYLRIFLLYEHSTNMYWLRTDVWTVLCKTLSR